MIGLRAYLALAKAGYRRHTAYPVAALAGLFTNLVFGALRAAVMIAAFAGAGSQVGGYRLVQALTYVWLVQGLMTVVQMYGSTEVGQRVRTGELATDLVRPVDLQLSYLAADLGRAAYHLLYRGIPPVVVGALLFDLAAPGDPLGWLAFAASVPLAVTVSFLFRFLYNLSAFWLLDYRGVALVAIILLNLLSGFVVPVNFFPDWLRAVAVATPFPSIIQTPVDIFCGYATGAEALGLLAQQVLWVAVLAALGRVVFAAGRRQLVFQGG